MSTMREQTDSIRFPDMSGKIMTVRGPIDPGQLGVTIMHEHIFIDLRKTQAPKFDTPATNIPLWDQKLTLENLHMTWQRRPIGDNYMFADDRLAIAETADYRDAGGNAIVDVSSKGLHPDPLALRRVSYATGVNVVMGTGFYTRRHHPEDIDQRTVEDMANEIIRDITEGVIGTGIRSGVIGEVGVDGNPLIPNEIKSIRAAARASRATGAAISFHRSGVMQEKHQVLDIASEEGAEMSRVILGHSDSIAGEPALMRGLMERGAFIQLDLLGKLDVSRSYKPTHHLEGAPNRWTITALDAEGILSLIEAGYADRILLSHDLFPKAHFKSYGGTGFAYVLEKFLPHLRALGVTEEHINKFMVENPARALTFSAPR